MKHLQLSILLLVLLNQSAFSQNLFKKASTFYRQNKIDSAIAYCERTLQEDTTTRAKLLSYNLLGVIYKNRKEYDLSLNYFNPALGLARETNNEAALSAIYNNTGQLYRFLGNYKQAKINLSKALLYDTKGKNKGAIFNNLGELYRKQSIYDSALFYLKRAIPLLNESQRHNALNDLGLTFQNKSQYDSAIYYLSEAYAERKRVLSPNHYLTTRTANHIAHNYRLQGQDFWAEMILSALHKNPEIDSTERMRSFILHGDLLFFQNKFAEAVAMYKEASNLAPLIRQRIQNRADKAYFLNTKGKLAEYGMRASFAVADYESAFTFAERNKGSILLEITQARNSLGYSPTISVSAIQEKLNPSQAVLSYAFFGDSLATFVITKNNFAVHRQPKSNIELLCEEFTNILEHAFGDDFYIEHSRKIYERLFAPIAPWLAEQRELLILPEGRLFTPFEPLLRYTPDLSQAPKLWDYPNFPYLMKDYTISYHFSASLAFLPRPKQNYDVDYVGIAPIFGDNYGELPFSILEVQGVKAHLASQGKSSQIYVGDDATKQKMKNIEANIFHIATHYHNGGLVFKDGSLTLKELYEENYRIACDLAVLSGCQTFYGKFIRGEGPVNLVSHFVEAGAENIIFSFNKVYDEPGQEIIAHFFKAYLNQGLSYAEALRAAKLKVLSCPGTNYVLWAGFGLINSEFALKD